MLLRAWGPRLRSRIANETLTGRSEMTMASSNTSIGVPRRSCSHETVEASFGTLCLQFTGAGVRASRVRH